MGRDRIRRRLLGSGRRRGPNHCDGTADGVPGGEGLGHGGRERTALAAMTVLEKRHRRGELA